MHYSILVTSVILGASLACQGGAGAPSVQSSADPSAASDGFGAAETPWKDKTRLERTDWMGLEVFPKMKMAFGEFDGESFGDFECQTCHGRNMLGVNFRMPSEIYALSASDPVGDAEEYDADMAGFMVNIVVPEMAKLLDTSPYDPETQQGLSCFACHPVAE